MLLNSSILLTIVIFTVIFCPFDTVAFQQNVIPIRVPKIQTTIHKSFLTDRHYRPENVICTHSSSNLHPTNRLRLSLSPLSDIITNSSIQQAFRLGTFGPQFLWVLMIVFPTSQFTKKIMGNSLSIVAFCLVHLFIVITSINQPDGTAPMLEFQGVFDPSPTADPLKAMMGMMQYPNFVSEEWTHVLTWDLFVGRWIWMDGLKRGIFTPHSLLLCNLIGPPGLLLHFITAAFTRTTDTEAKDEDSLSL